MCFFFFFGGGVLKKNHWVCFLFLGNIYVYAFVFRRELKIFTWIVIFNKISSLQKIETGIFPSNLVAGHLTFPHNWKDSLFPKQHFSGDRFVFRECVRVLFLILKKRGQKSCVGRSSHWDVFFFFVIGKSVGFLWWRCLFCKRSSLLCVFFF